MNTATILTKTDPKVKLEAQKTAKALGLSLSTVIDSFLRDFIKTKKLLSAGEVPTPYLENILKKAKKERDKDSPTFKNGTDAVKWLEDHCRDGHDFDLFTLSKKHHLHHSIST
jgi:addiction module RelB/DinJ family antitoxin